MGRQHQRIDRPGVRQVPEGSGERAKMEKTGRKNICGAPTTLAVKGLMMMMMMMMMCVCGKLCPARMVWSVLTLVVHPEERLIRNVNVYQKTIA